MITKNQKIKNLENDISIKNNENEKLKLQNFNLTNENRVNANKAFKFDIINSAKPSAKEFYNVEKSWPNMPNVINTLSKQNARFQQMVGGENIPNFNISIDDSSFFIYLLLLERAKYFKNRLLWKCEDKQLLYMLYDAMYYGALSGEIAIYKDDKGYCLLSVTHAEFDIYNNLVSFKGIPINGNSNVKVQKEKDYDVSKIVYYKFNNERFGLWVLCYFYLKNLNDYLDLFNTNTFWLNKKLKATIKNNAELTLYEEFAKSIMNDKSPVLMVDEDLDINEISITDAGNNCNVIWNVIITLEKWLDKNILGIRPDANESELESGSGRDLTASLGTKSCFVDKLEQDYNLMADMLKEQIINKFKIDIDWIDLNIDFAADAESGINNVKKVTEGNNK